MADSFAINKERIIQTQQNFTNINFLNRAFSICSANKETFENCFVKHIKGWRLYYEAYEEQIKKDNNKYREYRKMEDKQAWLAERDKRFV